MFPIGNSSPHIVYKIYIPKESSYIQQIYMRLLSINEAEIFDTNALLATLNLVLYNKYLFGKRLDCN